MGKNAYRKPRPSVPDWVWWDLDGCWFCNNRNNCNNCKALKSYNADINKRRKKRERQKYKQGKFEYE